MALKLHIPPCVKSPPHPHHPPPLHKLLRIRTQGPLETIQKLLPNTSWQPIKTFPQPGGLELANLTHEHLYGGKRLRANAVVHDEYLAWEILEKGGQRIPQDRIDYSGSTFDHLVPVDDPNPEVLALNLIEVDSGEGVHADEGKYAIEVLLFSIRPSEYT